MVGLLLGALLAAVATGCSSSSDGDLGEADLAAPCAQFRSVVTETAAGNVTEQELRDEFVDILDEAEAASSGADLADAARRVVSSLNAGDMVGFEQAFRDADAACTTAGF